MMHYNADTLDDYLHGELGPERDAQIHAHLEGCADCRALYDEAAGVRDWLQVAARAEEREFPSIVKARVWEAVRDAQPTWLDRIRAAWRPMIAVPVAGIIAAGLYISIPAVQGSHTAPGVAASYLMEEHAAVASENPLVDRGMITTASMIDSQSDQ
jgi:anti-sigma factor RsiW